MPQLGETVAEGKIVKWFKSAGDAVKPGDNLFEIETDKTSMEVPATFAGTLTDIRFHVGEVAKVGAVVAVIGEAGETAKPKPFAVSRGAPQTPLTPAKAGVQGQKSPVPKEDLGPRGRGDERVALAAPHTATPFDQRDPFRVVMTPERNYGPAKLPGGAVVTPLARRLASERGHRSCAHIRLRSAWPRRRTRCGRRGALNAVNRRQRRAGQGALCRLALRGSAARLDARDHLAAAGRS